MVNYLLRTSLRLLDTALAECILETSYPSRRIIRQTDNSFKYKSEDEFYSIIRLSSEFILETNYPPETDNSSLVYIRPVTCMKRFFSF